MRKAYAAIAVLLTIPQGCAVHRERQAAESLLNQPTAQSPVPEPVATPEQVLREFLVALIRSDEPTIRRTALTRPNMEILWVLPSPPAKQPTPEEEEGMIHAVRNVPVRRVRVGEVLKLPGKEPREMHVTENDVNDGHLLLEMAGGELPFILVKTDGRWRVDPGPMIVGRLKAAELRRQRAAESGAPGIKRF